MIGIFPSCVVKKTLAAVIQSGMKYGKDINNTSFLGEKKRE
jgi:hypothetical protein